MYLTPDSGSEEDVICRVFSLPAFLWPYIWGALFDLVDYEKWEEHGDMTVEEAAAAFYDFYYNPQECMIGAITPIARDTVPNTHLLCDGATYLKADYPALYAILSPSLIIDANSFTVPDLRGAFVFGDGNGRTIGDTGGAEAHTLTIAEMPAHDHGYTSAVPAVTTVVIPDEPSAIPSPATTLPAGGNQAHNNMPPFYVVKYAIHAK